MMRAGCWSPGRLATVSWLIWSSGVVAAPSCTPLDDPVRASGLIPLVHLVLRVVVVAAPSCCAPDDPVRGICPLYLDVPVLGVVAAPSCSAPDDPFRGFRPTLRVDPVRVVAAPAA